MVIYHAPEEEMSQMGTATEEQKAEGMKPWFAWKDSIGDKLVDFGNPLAGGTRILSDGSTEKSKKDVSGYSIIQAADLNETHKIYHKQTLVYHINP